MKLSLCDCVGVGVQGDDVLAKEHHVYERDRRLRCEDEKTSLRLSAINVLLVTFFLRRWQGRRRYEIGCYSARRGAAFHCIAWEMFEHWRKNNWSVRVWEFFVMKCTWLQLISQEKNLNEKTSNEALQVNKDMCWPVPFFFWFSFVDTIRSWRRPNWPIAYYIHLAIGAYLAALPTNPPECSHRVWSTNGWEGCSGMLHDVITQMVYWREMTGISHLGSQGTIFVWRSKLSFLSRVMFISKISFCFPRFCKIWCQRIEHGAFGFGHALELFLKLRSVTGHLFANAD